MRATGTNFHAVIHAQPMHITYLSHVPRYQDEALSEHPLASLAAGDDRQFAGGHWLHPVLHPRLA